MRTTNNSISKNFFVKAVFTLWLAFFTTASFASDFYWVGGTGNWSDYGTHWATTSGGVIFHTTIPGPADDVYFDVNSFPTTGDTVWTDTTIINCKNMDWTGVTNNPVLNQTGSSSTITIYGSLTLSPNMKWGDYTAALFKSGTAGKTITTAGVKIALLTFDNPTGSWSLADSLSARTVTVKNGTFSSNNHSINSSWFYAGANYPATNNATVLLGTSNITCNKWWEATDSNYLTLDADSATFIVGDSSTAGGSPAFVAGGNHVYGDITSYCQLDAGNFNTYHNINMIPPVQSIFGIVTGVIIGTHNTYNDVYFSGNEQGGFGGTGTYNIVHNVYFSNAGYTGQYDTYNKVVFNSNAEAGFRCTFDTLIFNNPGKTITFRDTTTVNSELVFASATCAGLTVIQSGLAGTKAIIKKATGNVTVDFAQLQDIIATGGATFTANNSINMGNVSGWVINSPAAQNLYWIGGTGNWNDINHWSTSSGGTGGSCIPTKLDNVFFDSNSFPSANDTVYLIALQYCKNMNWSGVTNNPALNQTGPYSNSTITIYGSLTLSPNMKWGDYTAALFKSGTAGKTITTAGVKIALLTFDNPTGSWSLADSLSARTVTVKNGTFSSNNHSINSSWFYAGANYPATNNATVLLGTSNITCNKWWEATDSNYLTLDADSATFIVGDSSTAGGSPAFVAGGNHVYGDITSYCQLDAGNFNTYHNINMIPPVQSIFGIVTGVIIGTHNTYNDVYFSGNEQGGFGGTGTYNIVHNVYFSNAGYTGQYDTYNKVVFNSNAEAGFRCTFDTLIFNNPGKTITFRDTTTVNSELVFASATCAGLTVIQSGLAGTKAIIKKATGNVTVDFAQLQDIMATGGATFTANNSIDGGNVTGWTINTLSSKNLYWVGGAGDWNDNNHWATTSGGASGNCSPTQVDNVFFDANSFSSSGDTVHVSVVPVNCHNMDWTGVTNNPVFSGGSTLKIYGSLTLAGGVKFSVTVEFNASTTGNTITTDGVHLGFIKFDNLTGEWTLNDSLYATAVTLKNGTLITNNQNINCVGFNAGMINYSKATAILGTSVITCNSSWQAQDTSHVTLDASSSHIIAMDSSGTQGFTGGSYHQYGDVTGNRVHGDHNTFNNVYLIQDYEYLDGSYNTFNGDVIFSKEGNFASGNSFAHNIYFAKEGTISSFTGGSTFDKVVFAGDAYFTNNNTFDTLIFNNPGKTITFSNTTTVNNHLVIASGLPAFPTSVHSNIAGTQATLYYPGDTLCSDYLNLQDINATGGAVFYAGNYSIDLGNNSGWQWLACTLDTSNVWPGDANYDLTANNVDLLYVGLGYGYTGTTRAGASNVWIAQPSVDWLQQFANGTNIKNADCNGDGIINDDDTLAVYLNYGQTHPFKALPLPSTNTTGIPFYLVSSLDTAGLNFNMDIDINLGNSTLQLNNLYGIAFTLNFTPGFIDTNNVSFDFSNSMLGTQGADLITFDKSFAGSGFVDVAMTRNDHTDISGFGHLARCGIVIVDNVAGVTALQFSITNVTAFDKNEFPVTLSAFGDSVVVDTNLLLSNHQIDLTQFVSVYPNPAKDVLKINGGILNIQSVELISIMGEKIYSKKVDSHTTSISTQNIKNGLYVLRCITDKGIINRRVQVLKY